MNDSESNSQKSLPKVLGSENNDAQLVKPIRTQEICQNKTIDEPMTNTLEKQMDQHKCSCKRISRKNSPNFSLSSLSVSCQSITSQQSDSTNANSLAKSSICSSSQSAVDDSLMATISLKFNPKQQQQRRFSSTSLTSKSSLSTLDAKIEAFRLIRQSISYNRDDNHLIIIFGASGQLALQKIYPSLWMNYRDEFFSRKISFIGFSRTNLTVGEIRQKLIARLNFTSQSDEKLFEEFISKNHYVHGDYDNEADFKQLTDLINILEKNNNEIKNNRVFYLTVPSVVAIESLTKQIHKFCTVPNGGGWNRLVLEKPFGHDFESFNRLQRHLKCLFSEEQIYRIDHHIFKEMIQSLLILRFSNRIFMSIWNRENISSVHISLKEPGSIQGKKTHFDQIGIIRDVMQNNLLQILSLVVMDKPLSLSSNDIRDEKVKALKYVKPVELNDLVLGQYVGNPCGLSEESRRSYVDDPEIPNNSLTPTFALALCHINNERWEGVPFFLRCGKALNELKAEIRIQFREIVDDIFQCQSKRNELVIRVQTSKPNELVTVKIMTKDPGLSFHLQETDLDLTYARRFRKTHLPGSFERLLIDIFDGSQMNFPRDDELQEGWRIFNPVLKKIEQTKLVPYTYISGSRGPQQAYDFLISKGFKFYRNHQWNEN